MIDSPQVVATYVVVVVVVDSIVNTSYNVQTGFLGVEEGVDNVQCLPLGGPN